MEYEVDNNVDINDIYGDFDNFDLGKKIDMLETENEDLKKQIQCLEVIVKNLKDGMEDIKRIEGNLLTNLSSLYKTAKSEVERKDSVIAELRKQLDGVDRRGVKKITKWTQTIPVRIESDLKCDKSVTIKTEEYSEQKYEYKSQNYSRNDDYRLNNCNKNEEYNGKYRNYREDNRKNWEYNRRSESQKNRNNYSEKDLRYKIQHDKNAHKRDLLKYDTKNDESYKKQEYRKSEHTDSKKYRRDSERNLKRPLSPESKNLPPVPKKKSKNEDMSKEELIRNLFDDEPDVNVEQNHLEDGEIPDSPIKENKKKRLHKIKEDAKKISISPLENIYDEENNEETSRRHRNVKSIREIKKKTNNNEENMNLQIIEITEDEDVIYDSQKETFLIENDVKNKCNVEKITKETEEKVNQELTHEENVEIGRKEKEETVKESIGNVEVVEEKKVPALIKDKEDLRDKTFDEGIKENKTKNDEIIGNEEISTIKEALKVVAEEGKGNNEKIEDNKTNCLKKTEVIKDVNTMKLKESIEDRNKNLDAEKKAKEDKELYKEDIAVSENTNSKKSKQDNEKVDVINLKNQTEGTDLKNNIEKSTKIKRIKPINLAEKNKSKSGEIDVRHTKNNKEELKIEITKKDIKEIDNIITKKEEGNKIKRIKPINIEKKDKTDVKEVKNTKEEIKIGKAKEDIKITKNQKDEDSSKSKTVKPINISDAELKKKSSNDKKPKRRVTIEENSSSRVQKIKEIIKEQEKCITEPNKINNEVHKKEKSNTKMRSNKEVNEEQTKSNTEEVVDKKTPINNGDLKNVQKEDNFSTKIKRIKPINIIDDADKKINNDDVVTKKIQVLVKKDDFSSMQLIEDNKLEEIKKRKSIEEKLEKKENVENKKIVIVSDILLQSNTEELKSSKLPSLSPILKEDNKSLKSVSKKDIFLERYAEDSHKKEDLTTPPLKKRKSIDFIPRKSTRISNMKSASTPKDSKESPKESPKRITPIPVKDPCSFQNILEKNETGFKIFSQNVESTLNLTDDGEIPILHLEDNHFNVLEDGTQKTFDKSIIKLLDCMNVSNLECDLTSSEVATEKLSFENSIAKNVSVETNDVNNSANKSNVSDISSANISNKSDSNVNKSATKRYRRVCRMVAIKKV